MTNATTNVARVAAAVAGLGLVAMSFAPLAGAQTAVTTTTTTTVATFTRDLTIGSTGADVTALQTWLIGKGFSIPAGATGYFGAQTKAALAAYQAANMISPAAGYFGPITRAKIAAAGGSTTTGGTTTTTTGSLSGGEADLNSYELLSGDDLMEGDSDTEIAVAKFDVDDGDAQIQRITVDFQATNVSKSEKPWDYIDTLSVYNGSKKVGDVDAGSKSDWDKEDNDSNHASSTADFYTLDIPVNTIIKEGDKAELSIRADAQSSIDDDDETQTFSIEIPQDGIRAVDAAGIQQYTGSNSKRVTLGFDAAEDGDLSVRLSSDSPDAGVLVADDHDTSDDFEVLAFEIKNSDNADADINEITIDTAAGITASNNIIRRATLTLDGDDYDGDISSSTIDFDDIDTTVGGDDTIDGVLTIQLFGQSGHYTTSGEFLTFSLSSANVDAEGVDTGDASDVSGSANGKKQTISLDAGLQVSGTSDNAVLTYNSTDTTKSYGTYTLKFDVTADGDDVYVPRSVATSTTASTTYTGVLVATNLDNTFSGTSTASLSSTADVDTNNSGFYIVRDGDTETFTVTVTLDPSTTGTYSVGLDSIKYSTVDTSLNSLSTLDIDQNDSEFRTDALSIQN